MLDEHALFLAWCDGDKKAGTALFDRHYEAISRFYQNKVDVAASLDLVQATFLACTESRDRFRGEASFRTFLFAIAHNLLRKHYRKRRFERLRTGAEPAATDSEEPDFAEVSAADISPSQSTLFRVKEEQRVVLEGLRHIPVECQEALELHYWEEMDTAEIAEIVGVPQGM